MLTRPHPAGIRRRLAPRRRRLAPLLAAATGPRRRVAVPLLATAGLLVAGCGAGYSNPAATPDPVMVVAAENFWGSIATQLGGTHARVQSIIVNPAEDPHSYEPIAADARTLATAQLAIVNGVGYDPWAPRLLAANPVPGRVVLNVGDLLGVNEGDNPHRWYFPGDVEAVANAITADLTKLDPKHSAYFKSRRSQFEDAGLATYHRVIATIRSRYAGTPVGASESIFAGLAPALGLRLITSDSFMNAVSEGSEVTAQDILASERQITAHQIKVWIYNSQNVTPEVQRLNSLARANHIPIATVTETLSPATDNFEQWQVAQLQALEQALHTATGR